MGILEKLLLPESWDEFYQRKASQCSTSDAELKKLKSFIDEKRYLPLLMHILSGGQLSHAQKHTVNKSGTDRKRVVYSFPEDENYILKAIAFYLYKYDGVFADCLYSFRKSFGVKRAVRRLCSTSATGNMYSYKADVHNYFNSVDVPRLMPMLRTILSDDPALYSLFHSVLSDPYVLSESELICESKGIMAGCPVSAFLANVYLSDLDSYFESRGVIYCRYSDDIIVFADSAEQLEEYKAHILKTLELKGLEINPDKQTYTSPGEPWTFLGIEYDGKDVHLSPAALKKIKAKLRRKAHALIRWRARKNLESKHAARAFIKYINRYFYSNTAGGELTWARWYFPLLTSSDELKVIDNYCVELIRFIFSERHSKSNFSLRYEQIKQWGYKPLVSEYYRR